ncbi:DUF397 domain-containing protein [Lentzea sp. BCCO 10_0856]|uniref:DUF397 domain-containing protein n=1 Tax=Lentzea miocenica TaxID=3095431 RepID=A0ABU4TFF7_9PSEU|nr:DUF397 domain-containing protein [Lentzea sp. BCCO 10_0856]MDX8036916.1 DUF397 domain-containing protein [Lentzea sp. BCCO 10_0856]
MEGDLYRFKKSTYSDNGSGGCVGVALAGGGVRIRDEKDPLGDQLVFGASAWGELLAQLKTMPWPTSIVRKSNQ